MNYETLYKITPKLDSIYQKILEFDKYDFDCTKFKDEINMFDQKKDSIKAESNNLMGAETLEKPDERLLEDLYRSIENFEKYIDKVLESFKVFDHYKGYQVQLNEVKDEKELSPIVIEVLNDLISYKTLLENGLNESDDTKSINRVIYNTMKKEYQLKGDSVVYRALKSYGLLDLIKEFVDVDAKKYSNDKKIAKNYNLYEHSIGTEEDTIELLKLISITDDNYKETIKENYKQVLEEQKKYISQIYDSEESIKESNDEIKETKKSKGRNRKGLLRTYITLLASIAILLGGGKAIYDKTKPKTKTYFRIDKECYDTVDGPYTTTSYSESYDNEVILKIYSEADNKGNRELRLYVPNETFNNIEDYMDYEASDEELKSKTTIQDNLINAKSTDEFKSVEIIKSVDLENKVEKTKSRFLLYLFEILLLAIWVILNIVGNNNDLGGLFYAFSDGFGFDDLKDLNNIRKKIKRQLEELKHKIDEDKELKNKYNELLVLEKSLYDKYGNYMKELDENDSEIMRLKKNK